MTAKKVIEYPAAATPPPWEPSDAAAFQALERGTADAGQQKRALAWLIHTACGTYDLDFRPDQREHAFVSGRRFVGLNVVKMMKVKLTALKVLQPKEKKNGN